MRGMLFALALAGLVAGLAAAIVGRRAELPGPMGRYQIAADDEIAWRVDTTTGEVCAFGRVSASAAQPARTTPLGCAAKSSP